MFRGAAPAELVLGEEPAGRARLGYEPYPHLNLVELPAEEGPPSRAAWRLPPFQLSADLLQVLPSAGALPSRLALRRADWRPDPAALRRLAYLVEVRDGAGLLRRSATLAAGRPVEVQEDLFGDGRASRRVQYREGLAADGRRDLDGDGRFEVREEYDRGNLVRLLWDEDGDGTDGVCGDRGPGSDRLVGLRPGRGLRPAGSRAQGTTASRAGRRIKSAWRGSRTMGKSGPLATLLTAAAACALLAAVSCRTAPPPADEGLAEPRKPLQEIILEDVQGMIERDEVFLAYQTIDSLQRGEEQPRIPAGELSTLKETAVRRMGQMFGQLVEQKKYRDAHRVFLSLQQVGEGSALPEAAAGWSSRRLLREMQRQYEEQGNLPLAYLAALQLIGMVETVGDSGAAEAGAGAAEPDAPAEAEYQDALRLAGEMGNAAMQRRIAAAMQERGMALPDAWRQGLPDIPAVEQVLGATVTIWVDRGIRLERGVGFPDRVIGSGFFIDRRGYLLTNYHVIASEVDPKYEGYSRLFIRLSGSTTERIPARVVGYDRIFDLALVKVEVTPPRVLSASPDVPVKPGGPIVAIGSPGGLENTITSGIISAVGRRFLQMGDAIQVDVPLNPGNSGGPLLNADGQLIGVVFAGIEQFEGVNFAVPFHWINRVLPDLYQSREAQHSWMGLSVLEQGGGLRVTYVVPGEAAEQAGLREGDILASLNGVRHATIRGIQDVLLELDAPSLVTVAWKRGGKDMQGVLALAPRPFSPLEVALRRDARDNLFLPLFGLKIQKSGGFLWSTDYVVKEVLQGSVADETGLSENDPLSIQAWRVDDEERIAMLRLYVKRKKAGFLESAIQLAAYLESDSFL